MVAENCYWMSTCAALSSNLVQLTAMWWHPSEPCIASTTKQGDILVWHCPTTERWGAFAGGFEEVDENVEYDEREDEFDIVSAVDFAPYSSK